MQAQRKECGGSGKKDTPVPMPNTEVKLLRAESSWWETACEDRALPRESKSQTEVWLFFCPFYLEKIYNINEAEAACCSADC